MIEKKVWILETKEGDGTAVFFSNPITLREAWAIWKKSAPYDQPKQSIPTPTGRGEGGDF